MIRERVRGEFLLAVAVAFALAIGSALVVGEMVVGSVNVGLVIGVSILGAALAAGNPESIVEAFVIVVLLGGTCVTALLTLPLSPVWQQVVVAACSGLCTTKLVLGVYCEFIQPPVIYQDPRGEGERARRTELATRPNRSKDRPSVSATQQEQRDDRLTAPATHQEQRENRSGPPVRGVPPAAVADPDAPVVQEYDIVRVVWLRTLERDFGGTDDVVRAPRVGDVAIVAHEYAPDDPAGAVMVEMLDSDGYTIWYADFDKDELEFIDRPESK